MSEEKTISKQCWASQKYDQADTLIKPSVRSKSMQYQNKIQLIHGGVKKTFKVYFDHEVGIPSGLFATIPMDVDEDCQTTDSVLQFGKDLCFKDLNKEVNGAQMKQMTQMSESMYGDWEDM